MTASIALHSRKYPGLVVLVDDADYDWLSQYSWCPDRRNREGGHDLFYARARVNGRTEYMHILILGAGVDHRDSNGLNNQRYNLRPATQLDQSRNKTRQSNNKSGFKGVTRFKPKRSAVRWQARITVNRKIIFLGVFLTPELAAAAYDSAAREYFGPFAKTNSGG
jgi:hypothetical protein